MNDVDLIEQMVEQKARRADRRELFRMALGAAVAGGALSFASQGQAQAAPVTDNDILNFALNLEYLEANFYWYAAYGAPIPAAIDGVAGSGGPASGVAATGFNYTAANGATVVANTGARAVNFTDRIIREHAFEIANDELNHVNFLRSALGSLKVAQPQIDVGIDPNGGFSQAARAAFGIAATDRFDPYASDLNFLYGAFIFEDVGVTAYKGSSGLLASAAYIDAAAGILATEAYHAALIRVTLDNQFGDMKGLKGATVRDDTELVSDARDSVDGTAQSGATTANPVTLFSDDDQGIRRISNATGTLSNIVPTDSNGLAFSRTAAQALNVVYLSKGTPAVAASGSTAAVAAAGVSKGGFFPTGVNGNIKTSAANA